MNTTETIIGAGVIVTGSTVIRDVHQGHKRAAPIIFGFMMVAGLLVISMAAPKAAKGLAYFAMVGAFFVNGAAVFGIAGGIAKSGSPGSANVVSVQKGGIFPTPSGKAPPQLGVLPGFQSQA
jgi:hypothetical protein